MSRRAGRASLVLVGVVAALAATELLCRQLEPSGSRSPERLFDTLLVPRRLDQLRELLRAGGSERDPYNVRDPVVGWRPRANVTVGLYHSNGGGFRSPAKEYEKEPRPGVVRIAAFGDSFTHCDEVPYEDCWTHLLEQRLGANVEVLNFGVQGYGTDQALLRYRESGLGFKPSVVILGLMVPGDLWRNVNVFRYLEDGFTTWTKPRFVLDGSGLGLINQPAMPPDDGLKALEQGHPLLAFDYWYDPWEWQPRLLGWSDLYRLALGRLRDVTRTRRGLERDAEPTEVTARIVQLFRREVAEDGARFVCVLIVGPRHLKTLSQPLPWKPLLDRLASDGIPLVDPTQDFEAVRLRPELSAPEGHFSRLGNEVIAHGLEERMRQIIGGAGRRPPDVDSP